MRLRRTTALVASVAAAAGAGGVITTLSNGSSHREAPLTALDPTGDDTDVYAFKAADAPNALTLVGNWIPFEDPAGGPNFYRFDDRASYYLNIDNTGDGRYDVRYRFKFHTKTRDKNSFLYALPGVSSILDPKLNVVQTYDVTRETYRDGKQVDAKVVGARPPDRAQQRRAQDDPRLRGGRRAGQPVHQGRREGVRGPDRRPVLRRPRDDVRRAQHPQGHGRAGRRPRRRGGLQRPLDRPAGARGAGHERRQARRGREGRQRGRRRVVVDRAAARAGHGRRGRDRAAPGTGHAPRRPRTTRSRSAASATRWSTRS